MKGSLDICIVVFCRYTNHEYETRTDRVYRLVNCERRMYYATGTNHVSPKIFGSCFWFVRTNRTCMHKLIIKYMNTMCVLVLLRMCGRLLIFGVVNGILVVVLVKSLIYLSAFQPLLYQNQLSRPIYLVCLQQGK
jgi:hypothetical protein